MHEKWSMPEWMEPYAALFVNTGREPTVEAITEMNNGNTDPRINLPLSTLEACVKSQVGLLHRLRDNAELARGSQMVVLCQLADDVSNYNAVGLGRTPEESLEDAVQHFPKGSEYARERLGRMSIEYSARKV